MADVTPHEHVGVFEARKRDHIRLSLDPHNQAGVTAGFERVDLIHEALPDLDFDHIQLKAKSLNQSLPTPFLISSMTAGHAEGMELNRRLASASAKRGWWMGVGSQRRQLYDPEARREWQNLREQVPDVVWLGNLGIAQLIEAPLASVLDLIKSLNAVAMIVHLNSLQECLQGEGTPKFRGGLEALRRLVEASPVPVVVKETGCGFSLSTLQRLNGMGLGAVDVSGLGGTHWGRIEGSRAPAGDFRQRAAETFGNWGISTVESLLAAAGQKLDYELWASGGVRSGLDAAKALALGARMVGVAQPALAAAVKGQEELERMMEIFEFELRTAMFCTGISQVDEFQQRKVWQWRKI